MEILNKIKTIKHNKQTIRLMILKIYYLATKSNLSLTIVAVILDRNIVRKGDYLSWIKSQSYLLSIIVHCYI